MHDVLDRHAAARATDVGSATETAGVGPPRPASTELLRALRPDAGRRRPVDPGLAGGLRAWLEDGVAPHVAGRPAPPGQVTVDRWSLAGARSPAPGRRQRGSVPPTVATARQAMVGCLFRQLATVGTIGRPFADALAGLRVDDRCAATVRFVSELPRTTRQALRREVEAHAQAMAAGWPALPPGWLPRTTARLWVPLAGGRAVLRATAALVLGPPPRDRASVCLVDVRAGEPRAAHADDRRFLALVETLRSGAPPCRVATYYPVSGRLDADDPTDATLASTVAAVTGAVERLVAEEVRHP